MGGLGFGPARLAVVGDLPLLRELLAMPTDRFRWGHKFNVLGFVVGPGSMIVSDGTDHHRRRSSVQTAFCRKAVERLDSDDRRAERNCIGVALAQMELTLIIARLAQRLDLTPASTTIPRPVGMVVNRPTGGASFRIELRHHRKQQAPTE